MRNKITITMPYYEAPEMLKVHLKNWCAYPDEIADRVNIILVDDGSPTLPAEGVLRTSKLPRSPIQLYRIQENIPWNHGGARNLAFDQMDEGWAVLTDMDHALPKKSIQTLLSMNLVSGRTYKPARYRMLNDKDSELIHRHCDSFILEREMFWKVGGFDEYFSGYWNGVSGPFRRAIHQKSKVRLIDNVWFLVYGIDVIKDACITSMGRKGSEYDIQNNKNLVHDFNMAEKLKRTQPKKKLQFTWERVL